MLPSGTSTFLPSISSFNGSENEEMGTSDILDIYPRTTITEFESSLEDQIHAASSLSYKQKYIENFKRLRQKQAVEHEDQDENMTVKVIAEGIAVTAPQTFIHHRHKCKLHPRKPNSQPSFSHSLNQQPTRAAASEDRLPIAAAGSDSVCHCVDDLGGMTDDERAHWEKKVRKHRLKDVRKH